jgi:hypothetical protein
MSLRLSIALAALVAALLAPAGGARTVRRALPAVCGDGGYAYAGYESTTAAFGVAARLQLLDAPRVSNGHVAGWVGVGGPGMGPHGEDEWLQAGYAAFPDGRSELYYEYASPLTPAPVYVALRKLGPGETHAVAVEEVAGERGAWRVTVDGRAVSRAIRLPGSHGAWRPVATSESWDGGVRSCNDFAYAFRTVAIATRPGGGWRPFPLADRIQDRGYRVTRAAAGFTAEPAV